MPTIGIIGTRGIPNGHGGFERFVELLVDHPGWQSSDVTFKVYGERDDAAYNGWTTLRQVGFRKDDRPFGYYFRSAMMASRECDIVLCCGVGLSLFAYWPALKGKTLIINPDGCEWRRTKWSAAGRFAIRMMYAPAIAAAKLVVIDAEALREDFSLGSKAHYIAYPAPEPQVHEMTSETRERFSLSRPYFLVVARLEPENNIEMAVDAFRAMGRDDVELIVVGGKGTAHYREVLDAKAGENLRFVGGVYDQDALNQLRAGCIGYFHGHSVGGTNPSLLEALATIQGQIVCHRNKYTQEVAGAEAQYAGTVEELSAMMGAIADSAIAGNPVRRRPSRDERFHPDTIFNRYANLFEEAHAAG